MINDEKVLRIIEDGRIVGNDKLLLIYILSRESEPTTTVHFGPQGQEEKITLPGRARVPLEQISDKLGKGFTDETRLRSRLRRLKTRGFLDIKQSKGNEPNSYQVCFPPRQKKQKSADEPEQPTTEAGKITP